MKSPLKKFIKLLGLLLFVIPIILLFVVLALPTIDTGSPPCDIGADPVRIKIGSTYLELPANYGAIFTGTPDESKLPRYSKSHFWNNKYVYCQNDEDTPPEMSRFRISDTIINYGIAQDNEFKILKGIYYISVDEGIRMIELEKIKKKVKEYKTHSGNSSFTILKQIKSNTEYSIIGYNRQTEAVDFSAECNRQKVAVNYDTCQIKFFHHDEGLTIGTTINTADSSLRKWPRPGHPIENWRKLSDNLKYFILSMTR
ncbi:hypothetical protein [Pseudovibrio sp. Alg231-02]|uniref:hypothetical protein n=1 Tax=Pseudovibrio sp. Alg231-02 TaxID=1922223 RepID=UPI000D54BC95|nr:hypothetical protein [Pseudovibrio sp. Alg231-02]